MSSALTPYICTKSDNTQEMYTFGKKEEASVWEFGWIVQSSNGRTTKNANFLGNPLYDDVGTRKKLAESAESRYFCPRLYRLRRMLI